MSDGYPAMAALLGLLALAGYQNRDKIAEWLGGADPAPAAPQGTIRGSGGRIGGLLCGLLGGLPGDRHSEAPGAFLKAGPSERLQRFRPSTLSKPSVPTSSRP